MVLPYFCTNLIDIEISNGHELYCIANSTVPLLKFRREIEQNLNLLSISDLKQMGRPSFQNLAYEVIPESLRTSGDHF